MKYRKKPVVIDAMQFTNESKLELLDFVTCKSYTTHDENGKPELLIDTLEGQMVARLGDWIIKGVKGEFYPVKDDIFQQTYERSSDEASKCKEIP